jgi:hypothetical protein
LFDYLNDNISLLIDSAWADTSRFWTVEEVLATIGPPHFEPGQGWSYSNTGYMLSGEVIEAVTGNSWVDEIHDIIFDPLEMNNTFIGAYEPRNGPVAAEWDAWSGQVIVNSPMTAEYSMMHAAGGILAVAAELVYWYNILFEGEIIGAASMQEMLEFEPAYYYGLGIWGNQYDGKLGYMHTGGTLGYLSMIYYDVASRTVIAILYNGRDAVASQFSALLEVLYDDFPKKDNDAGIAEIIKPWSNNCQVTTTPWVVLENHGSDTLTSVDINYFIDGSPVTTLNWTGELGTGDTVHQPLNELTVTEGYHTFTCFTSDPNGQEEGYYFNDTATSNFLVNISGAMSLPLEEGFESNTFPPEGWSLNSNSLFAWRSNFLGAYEGEHTAMKNNYQDGSFGAHYDLDLPVVNISGDDIPTLQFSYAYAKQPGNNFDSLQVLISSDCGDSWEPLFYKGGLSLSTAAQTYDPFYPTYPTQWKQEIIPLDEYDGDVVIRFRAICGASNNLYLDDVSVMNIVGDHEAQAEMSFSIFPNPANDLIMVAGLPAGTEIYLTDITGKTMYRSFTNDHVITIDLSSCPRGIYILKTALGSRKVVVW